MKNQFDELSKGLAQSVTRRAALKRVGVGMAVAVLAVFGLASKANATGIIRGGGKKCTSSADCPKSKPYCAIEFTGQGVCTRFFGPQA